MARLLSFYLPQFHPISENNEWWEPGFTEWTNVTRAVPQFRGHYQPHLPADLGFYDLRVHETMVAQAALAREYGIHGFVFYHYWFNGRRILETPIENWLKAGTPDFPFCLCWANENWSRRWDGLDQDLLLTQTYSPEDDRAHMQSLLRFFHDPRYLRVNGKPVFIVYRSYLIPDTKATTDRWREMASREGLDLYLIRCNSFEPEIDPVSLGFDASLNFQPDSRHFPPRLTGFRFRWYLDKLGILPYANRRHYLINYRDLADRMKGLDFGALPVFPGITPMWDNTARRKQGALILKGSTPDLYGDWLTTVLSRFKPWSQEEDFVFINAWNEWAEGNHLEPDQRWGRRYLEVTRNCLDHHQTQDSSGKGEHPLGSTEP